MNRRVTSRSLGGSFEPHSASPINRAAAVFLWLLACVTTWQAVAAADAHGISRQAMSKRLRKEQ